MPNRMKRRPCQHVSRHSRIFILGLLDYFLDCIGGLTVKICELLKGFQLLISDKLPGNLTTRPVLTSLFELNMNA